MRKFLMKRILPIAILGGFGYWVYRDSPETVAMTYRLGGDRLGLEGMRIDLKKADGTLLQHVEFRYLPGNAPAEQFHSARLRKGPLVADVTFEYVDGTSRTSHAAFSLHEEKAMSVALAPE